MIIVWTTQIQKEQQLFPFSSAFHCPVVMQVRQTAVPGTRTSSFRSSQHLNHVYPHPSPTICLSAKGRSSKKKGKSTTSAGSNSGGGFSKTSFQKQPSFNSKALLKRVESQYGGLEAHQIAQGTQKRIAKLLQTVAPPPTQRALQLYQTLQTWNRRWEQLSVYEQTQVPPSEVQAAQRAREELNAFYQEHPGMSDVDLHNLWQQITWDASADAKTANAVIGNNNRMPPLMEQRVTKACTFVGEALSQQHKDNDSACLDVGCGFGVLVPFLEKAGIARSQITGVDLSPEMIRNAQDLYPNVKFLATDFLKSDDFPNKFDAIVFCSSLHDFPDPWLALEKAHSLLKEGEAEISSGIVVIVHPQGASHVLSQVKANPVMVPRGLPDAEELHALEHFEVLVEPAAPRSREEEKEGYLAVLRRR